MDEDSGIRLPASSSGQMQATVVRAIVRGMMNGVSIKQVGGGGGPGEM